MNRNNYRKFRTGVAVFILTVIVLSATRGSFPLVLAGAATGIIFMTLARFRPGTGADERETAVREKAARTTYAVFAPVVGISSILLLIPPHSGLPIFRNGEFAFLEALGTVLACLTFLLIVIYAVSYRFLNRKFGGGDEEQT